MTELVKPASPPWDSDESDGPMTVAGRPLSSPPAWPAAGIRRPAGVRGGRAGGLPLAPSCSPRAPPGSCRTRGPAPGSPSSCCGGRCGGCRCCSWSPGWVRGMRCAPVRRQRSPGSGWPGCGSRSRSAWRCWCRPCSISEGSASLPSTSRTGVSGSASSTFPPSPGGCCRAGRGHRAAPISTPRTCGSCTSCWSSRSRCCRCLPTCGARGEAAHRPAGRFAERHSVVVLAAAIPLMVPRRCSARTSTPEAGSAWCIVFPFLYGFLIASDPRFEAALRRSRWRPWQLPARRPRRWSAWAGALSGSGVGLSGVPPGWRRAAGPGRLGVDRGDHGVRRVTGRAASARRRAAPSTARGVIGRPAAPRAPGMRTKPYCPSTCCHEPVIVAAAWLIIRWHAPIPGKYAALVIVSFAATFGLYEAMIRAVRLTRLLFGMKPRRTAPRRRRRTAASSPAPTVGSRPARHTVRSKSPPGGTAPDEMITLDASRIPGM